MKKTNAPTLLKYKFEKLNKTKQNKKQQKTNKQTNKQNKNKTKLRYAFRGKRF